MDLNDLDLSGLETISTATIITCTIEGIVDEGDLRELVAGRPASSNGDAEQEADSPELEVDDPTDLRRIREKHHSVARQIAAGMTQRLVASITGYSESYLSILLNNPAMQELVASYRAQAGAAAEVIAERLRTVGLKALEKLDEKIDKGALNNQDLLGAAKLGLDRSGHGPSSTSRVLQETHIIDHAEIARLSKAAREKSRSFIVDVAEVRQAALPAPVADGDEA